MQALQPAEEEEKGEEEKNGNTQWKSPTRGDTYLASVLEPDGITGERSLEEVWQDCQLAQSNGAQLTAAVLSRLDRARSSGDMSIGDLRAVVEQRQQIDDQVSRCMGLLGPRWPGPQAAASCDQERTAACLRGEKTRLEAKLALYQSQV